MPRKPDEITSGQPITARFLNALRDAVLKMLVGGNGIIVRRAGGQVVIEVADYKTFRRGGGNGAGVWVEYTGP